MISLKVIEKSQIFLYTDATDRAILRAIESRLTHAYLNNWNSSKVNFSLENMSTYPMRFENSVIDGRKAEDPSDVWMMMGQVSSVTFSTPSFR